MEMVGNTSRRGILGAMAGAPMLAALGATPFAALAQGPSAWSEAHARWKAADQAWDDFIAAIYNPACDRVAVMAPMPPTSFKQTALSGQSVTYSVFNDRAEDWDGVSSHLEGKLRKLHADYDAWKVRYAAARQENSMTAIEAQDCRLCEIAAAAREAALSAPVGTARELYEKTTFIREQFEDATEEGWFDAILCDLRRLGGLN